LSQLQPVVEDVNRYKRQIQLPSIGTRGQLQLAKSFVAVIGCGAVGSLVASALVRAGVGKTRIIDRDFIEDHNLTNHVLFDEDDIRCQLPKAIAAERRLKVWNSSVDIEGIVTDANYTNIEQLANGVDLIFNGTDNDESRFLINDIALKHGIPWVHATAVASRGMTMTIVPGKTSCYRCVFPDPIAFETLQTSNKYGLIAPASMAIGAIASAEVMKVLIGDPLLNSDQIVIDTLKGTFHRLKRNRRSGCPACQARYEFLEGRSWVKSTQICGQDAVQVIDSKISRVSLVDMASRLKTYGKVNFNEFMLRLSVDSFEIVLFPEGRAIIKNTRDEKLARGLYDKYIVAEAGE
jgi:adenylyltransferase/sulfurtransferase